MAVSEVLTAIEKAKKQTTPQITLSANYKEYKILTTVNRNNDKMFSLTKSRDVVTEERRLHPNIQTSDSGSPGNSE